MSKKKKKKKNIFKKYRSKNVRNIIIEINEINMK